MSLSVSRIVGNFFNGISTRRADRLIATKRFVDTVGTVDTVTLSKNASVEDTIIGRQGANRLSEKSYLVERGHRFDKKI